MVRFLVAALLLLTAPSVLRAEVVIERSDVPIPDLRSLRLPPVSDLAGSLIPKGNEPDDATWFIPQFKVDTRGTALGSSTFFSIRNEGDTNTIVQVEYFGTVLAPPRQSSARYALIPDQIVSVNVRDVSGLAVGPDRFKRGIIRITPSPDDPISVDVFQVDAANNFATGNVAFTARDFCDFWQVRFLDFGGASGSVMTILVNGPRGMGAANPPTISGTVFNQQGQPVNTFNLRTDQWSLEIPILDLVTGNQTKFGSVELVLNAAGNPGGVVSVVHSAFGKFSVGSEGVCKDSL